MKRRSFFKALAIATAAPSVIAKPWSVSSPKTSGTAVPSKKPLRDDWEVEYPKTVVRDEQGYDAVWLVGHPIVRHTRDHHPAAELTVSTGAFLQMPPMMGGNLAKLDWIRDADTVFHTIDEENRFVIRVIEQWRSSEKSCRDYYPLGAAYGDNT